MAFSKDYLFKDHVRQGISKEYPKKGTKRPRSKTPEPRDTLEEIWEDIPNCDCGERVKEGITQKEGPNKGRPYFACKNNVCGFFEWADLTPEEREKERAIKKARKEKKPPANFFDDAERNREVALTLLVQRIVEKQESDQQGRELVAKQLRSITKALNRISETIDNLGDRIPARNTATQDELR